MRKPLPARALCRLLFLVAAGAASRPALAQTISLPQPAQRAVVPAAAGTTKPTAGTPPELNKPVIPTVFTPAVTDEDGEPLCGVRLATASGTLTALTDSVGQVQLPGETLVLSIDKSVIQRFVVGEDKPPSIMLSTRNPAGRGSSRCGGCSTARCGLESRGTLHPRPHVFRAAEALRRRAPAER